MDTILIVIWTLLAGWHGIMHVTSAEVTFLKVKKNQYFDNLMAPSGYSERWQREGNDKGQCAARCRLMTDCVSFFVESSTSVCQFHSTILSNTDGMTSSANSTYYIFKEDCPAGTHTFKYSCYMIDTVNERDFNDSRIWCANMGGILLHVDDAEESSFFKELLPTLNQPYGYWMGLTDESVHGTWVWDDNGAVTTFTDWDANQPGINSERCAVISSKGLWHDIMCNFLMRMICEL